MDNFCGQSLGKSLGQSREHSGGQSRGHICGQFSDKIWSYVHSARSMRILRLAHAIVSVPPSGLHRVTVGFCMEVVIFRYLTTK